MKYPTIRQIRAFVAVSDLRSFARAAEHLHVSQPALSETVTQLERTVGGRLLQRTTRSMQLTPLGELFLPRAKTLLKELERAMADLSDVSELKRGHVNIGCLASLAYQTLPRLLSVFADQHPAISLHLRDDNATGLHRLLVSQEIDFAITSRADQTAGVAFRPLRVDVFHVLCLADHPLASRTTVPWAELLQYRFIGWAKDTANRYAIDRALSSAGIALRPAFEFSQLGTMLGMVETGLGVAAVPHLACPVTPRHAAPRLIEPEISREIGISTLTQRALSPAAGAFVAMVEAALKPGTREPEAVSSRAGAAAKA